MENILTEIKSIANNKNYLIAYIKAMQFLTENSEDKSKNEIVLKVANFVANKLIYKVEEEVQTLYKNFLDIFIESASILPDIEHFFSEDDIEIINTETSQTTKQISEFYENTEGKTFAETLPDFIFKVLFPLAQNVCLLLDIFDKYSEKIPYDKMPKTFQSNKMSELADNLLLIDDLDNI